MYFYEKIKKNRVKLNETEEAILAYFLSNHDIIQKIPIREAAQKFYTAPNTISRMCKKLGFQGYTEFREALHITTIEEKNFSDFTSLDDQIVRTKRLLNKEMIIDIVHKIKEADKILVLGFGLSRLPANEMHSYLQVLGKNTQNFTDPHLMRHAAKNLTKQDLVIAFSISGETDNILTPVNMALVSGAEVLSITGFSTNTLSKISTYQLYGMTSKMVIDGIDVSDRLSFHYIVNTIFTEYLKEYLPDMF